jgi:putative MATE family efflux protein
MRPSPFAATSGPGGTSPPVWKVFLMFLAPMMVSNILQSLSGTINSVYLGHMIGVGALAAASAFFPVMLFLISFIMGLGAGASVLIGQAWGAQQPERVQAVAGTTLSCSLLGGVAVAILGAIFAPELLRALATPPDILASATSYARVMLLAMPGLFLFLIFTSILRGVGDMVTPLKALVVSTVVGLVLTPGLIRGWFGLAPMGVVSAAWAGLASFVITLVWLGVHLHRKGHALAPSGELLRHMRISGPILAAVMKIGIPTAVQMVIMSLAEVALLSLVNGFGSSATAAYGVGNQVLGYVQFPAMSIAIAASILGAQAIGAGHADRLGLITRTGLLLNVAITGSLLLVCYVFSRSLIGVFTDDPLVIETAQRMLHIILWSALLFGCSAVVSGVMRSSGTVLAPTLLSITAIVVVEVPVAWLLSGRIGIDGVWWAYPLTFATMLVLQSTYYRLVWRKRKIARLI